MTSAKTHRLTLEAVGCIAAAALITGCSSELPTKSGGQEKPVTLRLAGYTRNALTSEATAKFQALTSRDTESGLKLTRLPDTDASDPSSVLIKQVREGDVDLAVVATRSFDLVGFTSLQALNAPVTVESPAQAARFLADPVATGMLEGLKGSGVVGLSLVYDQLRQPLGYGTPVLAPADLKGAFVLGRNSQATFDVMSTLGATVHLLSDNDAEAAVASGRATAAEISMDRPLGQVSGPPDRPSSITANVQLSVKANIIIVNARVWAGLSRHQQDVLRSAATSTRDWAAGHTVSLADAAQSFCGNGIGNVVVADREQLALWRSATAPVVTAMRERNPVTARALDRLEAIVRDNPSTDVPAACVQKRSSAAEPDLDAVGDQSVVEGVWRMVADPTKLKDAGANAEEVRLNSGTWTFTIQRDGSYAYVEPKGRRCAGTFAVNGSRLAMAEQGATCDGRWSFTFSRKGDTLQVTPTPDFADDWSAMTAFFANPWTRIAQAPSP